MNNDSWNTILGWGPEEMDDLRFVGYSYIKQGHYEIAKNFFEALVVLNPDHPYDLQTLGAIYLQTGNNLMALNYFEKALRIEPQHAPTLLNRTKALLALGYRKQGLMQAEQLERHKDASIASQATALLLSYR